MSDFRKALLWTTIPIVFLSLISIGFPFLWLVAIFYLVGAIIGAFIYGVIGKRSIASGIWAGIGIGIISLGVTCFANIRIFSH